MFYDKMPFKGYLAPDDAGSGAGADTGDATGTETGAEQTKATFDELMADKDYQAEFDRRVAKALETQKGKMEKDYADRLAEQKTEAEKLAKMNAEQKAQYEREKLEASLQKREADITRRELRAEALNQLGESNLPARLADVLDYSSAEACTTSLKAVSEAFQEAVAAGVADATKGGKPPKAPPSNNKLYTREELAAMSEAEINANWEAVQQSLAQH